MTTPNGPHVDSALRARLTFGPMTRAEAAPMIERHYLGRWPGVVMAIHGCWLDGCPVGTVVYALPPRETSIRYGCPAWELARLWVHDSMPTNSETWLVARSIRLLRRSRPDVSILVSYADPSVGHNGGIYVAGNWTADGRTDQERRTPRFDYVDQRTGKRYSRRAHVPDDAVIGRVSRVSKFRYVYRLRSGS